MATEAQEGESFVHCLGIKSFFTPKQFLMLRCHQCVEVWEVQVESKLS